MTYMSYIKILDSNLDVIQEFPWTNNNEVYTVETICEWRDSDHPYIADYFRDILVMRKQKRPDEGKAFSLRIRTRESPEISLYVMTHWRMMLESRKYSNMKLRNIMKTDTDNLQRFLDEVEKDPDRIFLFTYEKDYRDDTKVIPEIIYGDP